MRFSCLNLLTRYLVSFFCCSLSWKDKHPWYLFSDNSYHSIRMMETSSTFSLWYHSMWMQRQTKWTLISSFVPNSFQITFWKCIYMYHFRHSTFGLHNIWAIKYLHLIARLLTSKMRQSNIPTRPHSKMKKYKKIRWFKEVE